MTRAPISKLLRERARVLADVRRFFDARGFVEVQTPVMVPSPGLDLHLDAFEVRDGDRGAPRWLITSPEYQMKRLLADGWERIYQVAPCFRRGETGARHNPEFTMLEWYRAHAGMDDVMRDTEQLVAAVTGGSVRVGDRVIDLRPPLERMAVCDAFARFAGWREDETLRAAESDEERYFRAFVEKVEPALERIEDGVFLVDFPAAQASLARKKPTDIRLAERFELHVAGVELCNGFGELVDPAEQRARLERDQSARRARGMPVYPIDERFLEALAGVPPSGGNALGLDRLAALACGTTEIAAVIAFGAGEI
ncbi:MAG TPA: EF-P lysine aminoacylase EpmA [Polyangiaceae bacterium]|nr:EF-P lysine aminoacylase EpmA [Polyangiaceae bacterium]